MLHAPTCAAKGHPSTATTIWHTHSCNTALCNTMCTLCLVMCPARCDYLLDQWHNRGPITVDRGRNRVVCAHREIVKRIDMWGIDMVFVVGGNGGNAGAAAIQDQCLKDGVICNIVGVPKSIDNDILVVCYTLHAVCSPAMHHTAANRRLAGHPLLNHPCHHHTCAPHQNHKLAWHESVVTAQTCSTHCCNHPHTMASLTCLCIA